MLSVEVYFLVKHINTKFSNYINVIHDSIKNDEYDLNRGLNRKNNSKKLKLFIILKFFKIFLLEEKSK